MRSSHCRLANSRNFPVSVLRQEKDNTAVPQPWSLHRCAPCIYDSQCDDPTEFCDVTNCCTGGRCNNVNDCAAQFRERAYHTVRGYDTFGYDLNPFQPFDDLTEAQDACNSNSECVAYNSYGFLKYRVMSPALWVQEPVIEDLPPWVLYIKKRSVGDSDVVDLRYGMNLFCAGPEFGTKPRQDTDFATDSGICRECVQCKETEFDCPPGTLCSDGCCVNNPCYTASVEGGVWVDAQYDTADLCDCPEDLPYCCMDALADYKSVGCYKNSCAERNKVMACRYICNAPDENFDSVMCMATEACCNTDKDGPPVCCEKGYSS